MLLDQFQARGNGMIEGTEPKGRREETGREGETSVRNVPREALSGGAGAEAGGRRRGVGVNVEGGCSK